MAEEVFVRLLYYKRALFPSPFHTVLSGLQKNHYVHLMLPRAELGITFVGMEYLHTLFGILCIDVILLQHLLASAGIYSYQY